MMNHGGVDTAGEQGFFSNHGGFGMTPDMGADVGGYSIPQAGGWNDMNPHPPGLQQPVGEGVLRALMNMGPMDAMDLSSWDSGNDAMR